MPPRLISTTISIFLLASMLSACGGTTAATIPVPVSPVPGIETLVAEAYLTMTAEVQFAPASDVTATPTLIPTVTPVVVIPAGLYGPFPAESCDFLRLTFEEALSVQAVTEIVPFDDMYGGTGTACRIQITGNGVTLGPNGALTPIINLLHERNWSEDNTISAAGPQTMLVGYRNNGSLGILTSHIDPSPDANCPKDQPIASCVLAPEQRLYTVTFDIARIVVYIALPADECAGWLAVLQPVLSVPLVTETVAFRDLTGDIGTACRLRITGTGLDFDSFSTPSTALGDVLTSTGWTLIDGADGPTGILREYTRENLIAVVTAGWRPSTDANCPSDQPISVCPLTPEQKLYTITIDFAQK